MKGCIMTDDFLQIDTSSSPTANPPAAQPGDGGFATLLKRLTTGIAGKIIMSMVVSMIGGAIMNSGAIFKGVIRICTYISILDSDEAAILKEKAKIIVRKTSETEDAQTGEAAKPGILAKAKVAVQEKAEAVTKKTEAKLEVVKEKAQEVKHEVVQKGEEVKDKIDDATDTAKDISYKLGNIGQAAPPGMTPPQNGPPAVAQQLPHPPPNGYHGIPSTGQPPLPTAGEMTIPPHLRNNMPAQQRGQQAQAGSLPQGVAIPPGVTPDSLPKNLNAAPKSPYNACCPYCRALLKLAPSLHKERLCTTCGRPYMPGAARAAYAMMALGRRMRP